MKARLLACLALILLFAALAHRMIRINEAQDVVRIVEAYAEGGPQLVAAFISFYAMATVLVLPSFFLTLAGGFLFGTWAGTLVNLTASSLGAALCFMLSRRFGGKAAPSWMTRNRRLLAAEQTLSAKGAQGVLYLRLTPFVPFSALNYGFGLTRVTFWQFVRGTFLGLLPKVWFGTLLGAAAAQSLR